MEIFAKIFVVCISFTSFLQFSYSSECVNQCTVADASLTDCWPDSLEYFTDNVIRSINEYSTVLLHIQRWKVRHPEDEGKFNHFEEDILERVLSDYVKDDEEYENGPLKEDRLRDIFSVIINETNALIGKKYKDEADLLPSFSCPIPCDYYPDIWIALFFVLFAAFVLACLSFFVYYLIHMKKSQYTPVEQRYGFS